MPRPQKTPDTASYTGKLAARLRELRERRGWTVPQVCDELAAIGYRHGRKPRVPDSTMYAYERAANNVPVELYPYIAKLYGYSTAAGWLPS